MTTNATDPVAEIRRLHAMVRRGVAVALECDGHCKSYEGHIYAEGPGVGRLALPDFWGGTGDYHRPHAACSATPHLELHLYVFGPTRHYTWKGDTWAEVVGRARRDVLSWMRERAEDGPDDPEGARWIALLQELEQ